MKKIFRGILMALVAGFFVSTVGAQQIPVLELFHGAECPHCHEEIKFLPVVQKMYPDLEIQKYEVWHNDDNKKLAEKRLAEFGQTLEGVPTNIIGDEVIVGFQKSKMLEVMEKTYGKPAISATEASKMVKQDKPKMVTILVILGLLFLGAWGYKIITGDSKK